MLAERKRERGEASAVRGPPPPAPPAPPQVVALGQSSMGAVGLVLAGGCLWRVVLASDAAEACALLGCEAAAAAPLAELAEVVATIESPWRPLTLPRAPRGTPFQARVWRALARIPAGETTSYGALARDLGMPTAARAVATACAANPFAVVVPCHRVVHAGGGLGGYRWGLARKRALLTRERAWAARRED